MLVTNAATVGISAPSTGRVFFFSADGTPIYDSRINIGPFAVNPGYYIEVADYTGDNFIVIVT